MTSASEKKAKIPSIFSSSYATILEESIHNKHPHHFLKIRRQNEQAEGLWRIRDELYDLSNFKHPGGKIWMELTKGLDITESYLTSHRQEYPEILKKYHVRPAKRPRQTPFTFEEDGFYMTLKRRVKPILDSVGTGPSVATNLMTDATLTFFLVMFLLAGIYQNTIFAISSGLALGCLIGVSHNYSHQRVQLRAYYVDFTCFSSVEWRIIHVLSHHLFPNTVQDLEVTLMNDVVDFFVHQKTAFYKWISPVLIFAIAPFAVPFEAIKRFSAILQGRQKFRPENSIILIEFLIMFALTGWSFLTALKLWTVVHMGSSVLMIFQQWGNGHHHPEVYHDGDIPRGETFDYGLYQVDCCRERPEFMLDPYIVLIMFSHHTLHHLFPTVDHSKLPYLYPVLAETLREFDQSFRMISYLKCAQGMVQQIRKETPTPLSVRQRKSNEIFHLDEDFLNKVVPT